MIEIALCPDDNYVMPCGITMVSLLENKKNSEIRIHIVGSDLAESNKNILQEIARKYDTEIVFYAIENKYLEQFDIIRDEMKYITASAYSRLFLPNLLPSHLDKVIYLDCDLMVLDSLSEMWNINIEGYSVAGVIDYQFLIPQTYIDLKYSDEYSYINSGVLLMNLKYWRENNTLGRCLEYTQANHENLRFKDQDVINGALHDSILLIPMRYNMYFYTFRTKINFGKYEDERNEALRNPVIVHFTTVMKPWFKESNHPMTEQYLTYKALSPWKKMPIRWSKNLPLRRKIRYYKRTLLYSIGFKNNKLGMK